MKNGEKFLISKSLSISMFYFWIKIIKDYADDNSMRPEKEEQLLRLISMPIIEAVSKIEAN